MKPLPPTQRPNWRYIAAEVVPQWCPASARDMHYAILGCEASLLGDSTAAFMRTSVVSCEGGVAIVRCIRGTERDVETVLATVTEAGGARVALHPFATSGTIHGLKKKIRPCSLPSDEGSYKIGENTYRILRISGQKVDLVQQGIKQTTALYLNTDDLEDF